MMLTESQFESIKRVSETSLTYNEALYLQKVCEGKHVLELGCYTGASTYIIGSVAQKIYSVDAFKYVENKPGDVIKTIEEVKERFYAITAELKNMFLLQMEIKDFFQFLSPSKDTFDVIFIDSGMDRNIEVLLSTMFTRRILLHDYKFEAKIFPDGRIDNFATVIAGAFAIRNLVERYHLVDTLLSMELKEVAT